VAQPATQGWSEVQIYQILDVVDKRIVERTGSAHKKSTMVQRFDRAAIAAPRSYGNCIDVIERLPSEGSQTFASVAD